MNEAGNPNQQNPAKTPRRQFLGPPGLGMGHVCGSTRGDPFEGNAKLPHQLLHKVYHRFGEEYGTVLCRDVRKGAEKNCPKVVGRAARWTAEVPLEEFADP